MECQFVKALSKTLGILSLSSGESELAAVVRAAKEKMGLQSMLSDFSLCGHVAIKSWARTIAAPHENVQLGTCRWMNPGDGGVVVMSSGSRFCLLEWWRR